MRKISDLFDASTVPLIVAEVALAHDGSLGLAHAFIDAAARTGVDAIKYQTHIAAAESSPRETFRVQFSKADATRYDYWKRTEFSIEQWRGLKTHAYDKGLLFLSSPFSLEAVELLDAVGMVAWKVPSGEVGSHRMLERMASTGRPLLVSTGMSSYGEVDELVGRLNALCPGRYAILQCTTQYPTPAEAVGLNVLIEYTRRYGCPVGLSDHSGTIYPALIGSWLGVRLIEVHLTLSRDMFGPDVSSSLTVEQMSQLVEGVRFVHVMRTHPVNKDAMAATKAEIRRLFGKSVVAARPLKAGDVVSETDVAYRKPGIGIPEAEFGVFFGRKLQHAVDAGHFFVKEDFE